VLAKSADEGVRREVVINFRFWFAFRLGILSNVFKARLSACAPWYTNFVRGQTFCRNVALVSSPCIHIAHIRQISSSGPQPSPCVNLVKSVFVGFVKPVALISIFFTRIKNFFCCWFWYSVDLSTRTAIPCRLLWFCYSFSGCSWLQAVNGLFILAAIANVSSNIAFIIGHGRKLKSVEYAAGAMSLTAGKFE